MLCLDIEGGYGGSSRSLYYLVKHMDSRFVKPEVWCRSEGPIVPLYKKIGVNVQVEPSLPKVSSLPRFSRNVWALIRYQVSFWLSRSILLKLVAEIEDRFDVVHFNHEAFYLLAAWLRPRVKAGFVMHNRTLLKSTWFSRRQARLLFGINDVNVFITKREKNNLQHLAGLVGGRIIHNVVEIPKKYPNPYPISQQGSCFIIACLANYSWKRGLDRVVDVAVSLQAMGREDVRFVVGGNHRLTGNLPGVLGQLAANDGTLHDYAVARGVADHFVFLGHISEPEKLLAASDALIKPSREDNPWGRDILEALAMGLPVFACGTYDLFVKPGISGYLYPHDANFDSQLVAADIARLVDDPALCSIMSSAAVKCVDSMCDGKARAADLLAAWRQAFTTARTSV